MAKRKGGKKYKKPKKLNGEAPLDQGTNKGSSANPQLYAEKEGSTYLPVGDIREDNPGKTWIDIKAQQDAMFKDDADDYFDDFFDNRDRELEIVDTYSGVDEYTWLPLHFLKN